MTWLRAFIYSNAFVALLLSLLTASTYFLFEKIEFRWYVPVSVCLGSFVLYSFHRLYKIDFIPSKQLSARHHWVLKYAQRMKYAMSFAVFLMMLILPNFNADTIVWLVPAGIVSVGYTIPILPSKKGWSRLRDIPLTKPLIIALVVSYLTLAFPIFEQHGVASIFDQGVINALAERVLFLLAVTIPFDLRDVPNDRDAGIDTLGTQLGFEKSKRIGYLIMLCWSALLMLRVWLFGVRVEFIAPVLIVGVLVLVAMKQLRPEWSDLKYILVFEGLIVLYALASSSNGLVTQ